MLALYHNPMSTCSQKVRMALAEKKLDFESREVDLIGGAQHDPEYVKLNPNHVVPTLIHDDRVLIESTLINEYLEDAFPAVPLTPADPAERHAMRMWTKRVDEKVHPNAGTITYAVGVRPMLQSRPPDEVKDAIESIPDPARRAVRLSVFLHGVKAPEFGPALVAFIRMLDDMDETLADRPWLAGDTFSLADIAVMPYVARLEHLAMDPLLGADVRPNLAAWYARIQSRPAYETAVRAWAPDVVVELFREHGQRVWSDVEPLTQ